MEKAIKVLAVDDEEYMLQILSKCLTSPMFEVTKCSNAMQAMSIFKSSTFDIIILDVITPSIDGFELHSLIRNVREDIPIIMLTAKVGDIDGTMLKRISSDKNTYYQSKSFKKTDLVEKITSIIREKDADDSKKRYFEEMEKDVALAGNVQEYMFPNWDGFLGDVRYDFYYRPYMKITGDIVIFKKLNDGKILFFIGDISGHGIQAALWMSAVEHALTRNISLNPNILPHDIMNMLQRFVNSIITDRYMTAIAAIFDFSTNTLTYQNAGHPDLLAFSPSLGKTFDTNPQKKGSIPIGLVADMIYKKEDTVTLTFPKDAIFFGYTDGLTDLENELGKTYNTNPIEEFLVAFTKGGMNPAVVYKIIDALFRIGFNKIKDDIAIAAVSHYEPKKNAFDFIVRLVLSDIDSAVQKISSLVCEQTGNEELASKVELLSSEFMNNMVVHGLENKKNVRNVISIHIEFEKEDIILTFFDKGKRWDMDTSRPVNDDDSSDILNFARATSGRGLPIMKRITSDIRRSRYADTLNETTFTVKIPQ